MEQEKKKYPELPVLVVDDDKVFLNSIDFVLLSNGITNVECCHDSMEVMTLLEAREYSVILLDLKMEGITGEELLTEIVKEYPDIRVIILTAINMVEIAVRCIKKGAVDYLVKPVDTEKLIRTIKKALDNKDDHELKEIKDTGQNNEAEYKTTIFFHAAPPGVFSSKEKEQEEEKNFLRSLFKCGTLTIEIETIENGTNKKKIELRGNEKSIFCYLAYKNFKALKKGGFPDWKSIPDSYEFRISANPEKNQDQKPEWEIFLEYIEKIEKKPKPVDMDIRQWKFSLDKILKEQGITGIIHTQKGRGKGYLLKGRVEFLTITNGKSKLNKNPTGIDFLKG
jgi:FixJ family two-component response regulator